MRVNNRLLAAIHGNIGLATCCSASSKGLLTAAPRRRLWFTLGAASMLVLGVWIIDFYRGMEMNWMSSGCTWQAVEHGFL